MNLQHLFQVLKHQLNTHHPELSPPVFLNRLVNSLRSPSKCSDDHVNNASNDVSHIPMYTVVCSETETNSLLSVADNVPKVEIYRSLLNKQNNKQNNTTKSTLNMDETNVKQVAEN